MYRRRRRIVMEDHGGLVPAFAAATLGDGAAQPRVKDRKPQPVAVHSPQSTEPPPEPEPEPEPPPEPEPAPPVTPSSPAQSRKERAKRQRQRKKHGRR